MTNGDSQVAAPPAAEQGRVERAAAGAGRPSVLARVLDTGAGRNLGLVAVLVVLCVIGVATADTFATTSNLLTILTSASIIGVITVGVTIVIIGGGIDLSVGKVMALASVWATTLATQSYGPAVMVFCALAVGAGCGLVNGVLIAYGRIVPFIATLAMLISAQGLAERISGKRSQIVTDPTIAAIASTRLLGAPLLVYLFAAVVAVGWVLLNRTTFGRRTFAIGGNPEAARLAGLHVRRHTVSAGNYIGTRLRDAGVTSPIIGEVAGIDSLPLTQQRSQGFRDALQSYGFAVGPRQAADFTAQGGQRVTANLLQAAPRLDALWNHDDDQGIGVLAAIQQANRSEFFMVGGAGSANAMRSIQADDTVLKATVTYSPTMASSAVALARLVAQGRGMSDLVEQEVPASITLASATVTRENVAQYLPLGFES